VFLSFLIFFLLHLFDILNAGLTAAPTLRTVVSPSRRKEDVTESARHTPSGIFGAPEKDSTEDEQVNRTASTMWRRDPLLVF
jgi:hypothetical protein